MFIKLTNCLEEEDNSYKFGDMEYYIPIKNIVKMFSCKEDEDNNFYMDDRTEYYCLGIERFDGNDTNLETYYFPNKEDRDAVIEQIVTHPVFVESFNK